MASEIHNSGIRHHSDDLNTIQDEDILRHMWQQTRDFGRKKEIRTRMYKLREERLKSYYVKRETNSQSCGIDTGARAGAAAADSKSTVVSSHAESLSDRGFISAKTKEIRDSASPTLETAATTVACEKHRIETQVTTNESEIVGAFETYSSSSTTDDKQPLYLQQQQQQRLQLLRHQQQEYFDDGTRSSFQRMDADRTNTRSTIDIGNGVHGDGDGDGICGVLSIVRQTQIPTPTATLAPAIKTTSEAADTRNSATFRQSSAKTEKTTSFEQRTTTDETNETISRTYENRSTVESDLDGGSASRETTVVEARELKSDRDSDANANVSVQERRAIGDDSLLIDNRWSSATIAATTATTTTTTTTTTEAASKISLDVSATHNAFASSLRASPTPSSGDNASVRLSSSKSSTERSSPEKTPRASPEKCDVNRRLNSKLTASFQNRLVACGTYRPPSPSSNEKFTRRDDSATTVHCGDSDDSSATYKRTNVFEQQRRRSSTSASRVTVKKTKKKNSNDDAAKIGARAVSGDGDSKKERFETQTRTQRRSYSPRNTSTPLTVVTAVNAAEVCALRAAEKRSSSFTRDIGQRKRDKNDQLSTTTATSSTSTSTTMTATATVNVTDENELYETKQKTAVDETPTLEQPRSLLPVDAPVANAKLGTLSPAATTASSALNLKLEKCATAPAAAKATPVETSTAAETIDSISSSDGDDDDSDASSSSSHSSDNDDDDDGVVIEEMKEKVDADDDKIRVPSDDRNHPYWARNATSAGTAATAAAAARCTATATAIETTRAAQSNLTATGIRSNTSSATARATDARLDREPPRKQPRKSTDSKTQPRLQSIAERKAKARTSQTEYGDSDEVKRRKTIRQAKTDDVGDHVPSAFRVLRDRRPSVGAAAATAAKMSNGNDGVVTGHGNDHTRRRRLPQQKTQRDVDVLSLRAVRKPASDAAVIARKKPYDSARKTATTKGTRNKNSENNDAVPTDMRRSVVGSKTPSPHLRSHPTPIKTSKSKHTDKENVSPRRDAKTTAGSVPIERDRLNRIKTPLKERSRANAKFETPKLSATRKSPSPQRKRQRDSKSPVSAPKGDRSTGPRPRPRTPTTRAAEAKKSDSKLTAKISAKSPPTAGARARQNTSSSACSTPNDVARRTRPKQVPPSQQTVRKNVVAAVAAAPNAKRVDLRIRDARKSTRGSSKNSRQQRRLTNTSAGAGTGVVTLALPERSGAKIATTTRASNQQPARSSATKRTSDKPHRNLAGRIASSSLAPSPSDRDKPRPASVGRANRAIELDRRSTKQSRNVSSKSTPSTTDEKFVTPEPCPPAKRSFDSTSFRDRQQHRARISPPQPPPSQSQLLNVTVRMPSSSRETTPNLTETSASTTVEELDGDDGGGIGCGVRYADRVIESDDLIALKRIAIPRFEKITHFVEVDRHGLRRNDDEENENESASENDDESEKPYRKQAEHVRITQTDNDDDDDDEKTTRQTFHVNVAERVCQFQEAAAAAGRIGTPAASTQETTSVRRRNSRDNAQKRDVNETKRISRTVSDADHLVDYAAVGESSNRQQPAEDGADGAHSHHRIVSKKLSEKDYQLFLAERDTGDGRITNEKNIVAPASISNAEEKTTTTGCSKKAGDGIGQAVRARIGSSPRPIEITTVEIKPSKQYDHTAIIRFASRSPSPSNGDSTTECVAPTATHARLPATAVEHRDRKQCGSPTTVISPSLAAALEKRDKTTTARSDNVTQESRQKRQPPPSNVHAATSPIKPTICGSVARTGGVAVVLSTLTSQRVDNIEEIFDVELLRSMLEEATRYDVRSRIRAQIRSIRRHDQRQRQLLLDANTDDVRSKSPSPEKWPLFRDRARTSAPITGTDCEADVDVRYNLDVDTASGRRHRLRDELTRSNDTETKTKTDTDTDILRPTTNAIISLRRLTTLTHTADEDADVRQTGVKIEDHSVCGRGMSDIRFGFQDAKAKTQTQTVVARLSSTGTGNGNGSGKGSLIRKISSEHFETAQRKFSGSTEYRSRQGPRPHSPTTCRQQVAAATAADSEEKIATPSPTSLQMQTKTNENRVVSSSTIGYATSSTTLVRTDRSTTSMSSMKADADAGFRSFNSTSSYSARVNHTANASTINSSSMIKDNSVTSPFAKFWQLEKQNSLPSSATTRTTTTTTSSHSHNLDVNAALKFANSKLSRSASSIKDRLLNWVKAQTKDYKNVQIDNFSSSWNNGLAFCALIHHFCPHAFDYDKLTPQQRRHNFELAFKVAEQEAGIVPLLDVDDMVIMKRPDWKCVFTYVQTIYQRFHATPEANTL